MGKLNSKVIYDSRNNAKLPINSKQSHKHLREECGWVSADSNITAIENMDDFHLKCTINYIIMNNMNHLYDWVHLLTYELQYRKFMIEKINNPNLHKEDSFWG